MHSRIYYRVIVPATLRYRLLSEKRGAVCPNSGSVFVRWSKGILRKEGRGETRRTGAQLRSKALVGYLARLDEKYAQGGGAVREDVPTLERNALPGVPRGMKPWGKPHRSSPPSPVLELHSPRRKGRWPGLFWFILPSSSPKVTAASAEHDDQQDDDNDRC